MQHCKMSGRPPTKYSRFWLVLRSRVRWKGRVAVSACRKLAITVARARVDVRLGLLLPGTNIYCRYARILVCAVRITFDNRSVVRGASIGAAKAL